jgi:hypothetical protein
MKYCDNYRPFFFFFFLLQVRSFFITEMSREFHVNSIMKASCCSIIVSHATNSTAHEPPKDLLKNEDTPIYSRHANQLASPVKLKQCVQILLLAHDFIYILIQ